jgi:hypothetical protein
MGGNGLTQQGLSLAVLFHTPFSPVLPLSIPLPSIFLIPPPPPSRTRDEMCTECVNMRKTHKRVYVRQDSSKLGELTVLRLKLGLLLLLAPPGHFECCLRAAESKIWLGLDKGALLN